MSEETTADGTATVLLVLPDRADAVRLAAGLAAEGYRPATVHRQMLAGEDDAEDVDWVVEVTTTPTGAPAGADLDRLADLAEAHDGFADPM